MNIKIAIAVLFSIVFVTCHAYDKPRERKYYDSSGHYTGKSVKQGNEVKHFDPMGHYRGKTVIEKREAKRYDVMGHYKGKSVNER